jgi:hypothetical protein
VILRGVTLQVLGLLALATVAPDVAAARPALDPFRVPVHADPRDAGEPLDLREAAFGQSRTSMVLELRTAGRWAPQDLAPEALCVALRQGARQGRLCVGARDGKPALSYTPRDGTARPVRAALTRPDDRALVARFAPRAIPLRAGRVSWRVETGDSVPDQGTFTARVGAFGAVRCFGAAARIARCDNPALRHAVHPSPSAALWMPDGACSPTADRDAYDAIAPCAFGDRETDDPPRVALIGDSHSGHLRAAVDVFAQARGWKAISMTRPGCAFSTEVYPAPPPIPARCRLHTAEALQWLRRHPSVTAVFTSNSAGRGLTPRGFSAAWAQAPASVRRIYAIRDVPRVSPATADCVRSVIRRRARSARACGVARSSAFPPDPAASAAAGSRGRVRLIDLSRAFCDASRCFPVVGGAYVYKDFNHLNRVFAATLGPWLLRATGHSLRPGVR